METPETQGGLADDDLVENDYYVLAVNKGEAAAPCLRHVVARYCGSYTHYRTTSLVFQHTLPVDDLPAARHAWNALAANFPDPRVPSLWASHVSTWQFAVQRNITPLVRRAVRRFRAKRTALCIWVLQQKGLPADMCRLVLGPPSRVATAARWGGGTPVQ